MTVNEKSSNLRVVEDRLMHFELVEIVKKEKFDYSLLHPLEGSIITSNVFIIAPLRSARDEADLAAFAKRIKGAIGIETTSEQIARATTKEVYFPILYFDEKIGAKRSEHKIEIEDESARIALKDIVRRDMDAVRYATGSKAEARDDGEGYSISELKVLEDEKPLRRRIVVKIYPDHYVAMAAASKLLKGSCCVERHEAEKYRALFRFPSSSPAKALENVVNP
jgi:hypothetical protein